MFSVNRFSIALVTLALAIKGVVAQNDTTQEDFARCSQTIRYVGFESAVHWDVNDSTNLMVPLTWNPTTCAGVPLNYVRYTNTTDDSILKCTGDLNLNSDGQRTFICPITKGQIASREPPYDGEPDFNNAVVINIGKRPALQTTEYTWQVYPENAAAATSTSSASSTPVTTTATPSAGAARRRRALETQSVLAGGSDSFCEAGKTVCQIKGRKGLVSEKCVDTQRDLFACGGCPGEPASQDCSEIAGVANVQCVSGACRIKACDRSHKLSSDGLNCIPKGNYVKRTFY